jgi:hypothetical protein
MANWYYYNESGDKIEVTGGQLKSLAQQGLIVPETVVETPDGKTGRAGKVKGLAFATLADSSSKSNVIPPDSGEVYGISAPPTAPSPSTTAMPEKVDVPVAEPIMMESAVINPPTAPPPPVNQPAPEPVHTPPPPVNLFCTNCGNSIAENAFACLSCVAKPTGHKKFCRHCGVGLNPEQIICIKCGAGIEQNPPTAAPTVAPPTSFAQPPQAISPPLVNQTDGEIPVIPKRRFGVLNGLFLLAFLGFVLMGSVNVAPKLILLFGDTKGMSPFMRESFEEDASANTTKGLVFFIFAAGCFVCNFGLMSACPQCKKWSATSWGIFSKTRTRCKCRHCDYEWINEWINEKIDWKGSLEHIKNWRGRK